MFSKIKNVFAKKETLQRETKLHGDDASFSGASYELGVDEMKRRW
jgi:hypothetical protein